MSYDTTSTIRSMTTPSPSYPLGDSEFRPISPSFANQHLNDLDKNKDLQHIQKVLNQIQDSYEAKLSIPIDPYHSVTWMELLKNPEHVGSRMRSHHMNVCFCFLFAVSVDPEIDDNKKTDLIEESLRDLSLDHSFDLYSCFVALPPIMVIFILPYAPAVLKEYVLKNASNPDLLLSWISVIFEHRALWTEDTQKYYLSLLPLTSFSLSRSFRIHTSQMFKIWFCLIKGEQISASNSSGIPRFGTVESFGDFNYYAEPNDLSEELLTLYSFIKEGKAERIQETLTSLQSKNPQSLLSAFLGLSAVESIHILTYAPSDMQKQAVQAVSDETLLLWVEAAFEYQESIGPVILNLIVLHVAPPSFLPHFQAKADPEIREWAARINPIFFSPPPPSCHCIIS